MKKLAALAEPFEKSAKQQYLIGFISGRRNSFSKVSTQVAMVFWKRKTESGKHKKFKMKHLTNERIIKYEEDNMLPLSWRGVEWGLPCS